MINLDGDDVARLLDLNSAIASQREAFEALGRGSARQGKVMFPGEGDAPVAFCYAARVGPLSGAVCKFGAVQPANTELGLPSVHALVLALDARTGEPVALVDGIALTAVRTPAATALAVDVLAPPGADELAVIGAGVQARGHVRAIAAVRRLRRVRLWSPTRASREAAADELARELDLDVTACSSAREAVEGAHLVVTCTFSREPVVRGAWLAAGATVVSTGSYEPVRTEVDDDLVDRAATVLVDERATAFVQAGPIVRALRDGRLRETDVGELGEVLLGLRPGRQSDDDVVFYNSTGLGVQDAAAVWRLLERYSLSSGKSVR